MSYDNPVTRSLTLSVANGNMLTYILGLTSLGVDVMRDYAKQFDSMIKDFAKTPNQDTAQPIIAAIFYRGPVSAKLYPILDGSFTSANDQEAALILEQVIQLYPQVDLNYRFRINDRELNEIDKNGFTVLNKGAEILPTYAVIIDNRSYDYTERCYYYTPCTPLMYAAHFNMPALMAVLLKQPAIDVTVLTGEPMNIDLRYTKKYQATAYAIAPYFAFTCKKMLREAAIKQFYGEALTTESVGFTLVSKYEQYGITQDDMLKHMISKVMVNMDAKENPEEKIETLKSAIVGAPINNALASFLGQTKLKDYEKNLSAVLEKIINKQTSSATKSPTRTFTDNTDKGGGINNESPEQSISALHLLKMAFPTKIMKNK
jgi:hypothetical protein